MYTTSSDANPNYLAKIVILDTLHKHPNADKLQIAIIDNTPIITDLTAQLGDVYIYFPVESKINLEFLSYINGFSKKELNADTTKSGFFGNNGRVKATKLRGEYSIGFILPIKKVIEFTKFDSDTIPINDEFDTINNILMVEKYKIIKKNSQQNQYKQSKEKRISRIIDGQTHLHKDTINLRKNINQLKPTDIISITNKTHGTSFWVSNTQTKVKPKWWHKPLRFLPLQLKENHITYGSRNVIKNEYFNNVINHSYYDTDLWAETKNKLESKIPKGFTVYGELLGYTSSGKYIQSKYDYGCTFGTNRIEIYRITHTNTDGLVTELSYPQMKSFCNTYELPCTELLFYGTVQQFLNKTHTNIKNLLNTLSDFYLEQDCNICKNKVPAEGIVIQKEDLFIFEAYKLKSFRFLDHETKQLDQEEKNNVIDSETMES